MLYTQMATTGLTSTVKLTARSAYSTTIASNINVKNATYHERKTQKTMTLIRSWNSKTYFLTTGYVLHIVGLVWFRIDAQHTKTIRRHRCYRSVVCLSVCLSVTFVHCAQTAEGIVKMSFAHDSPMSVADHLKFGLHRSNPSTQILHQSDAPTPKHWFGRRGYSVPNCGWMVRDIAMVALKSL